MDKPDSPWVKSGAAHTVQVVPGSKDAKASRHVLAPSEGLQDQHAHAPLAEAAPGTLGPLAMPEAGPTPERLGLDIPAHLRTAAGPLTLGPAQEGGEGERVAASEVPSDAPSDAQEAVATDAALAPEDAAEAPAGSHLLDRMRTIRGQMSKTQAQLKRIEADPPKE